ncbi:MAG: putative sulfate exporter family transporter, partial [Candidatus Bathyarchaeia archaeon]
MEASKSNVRRWSSLYKSEDWWAVWLGFALLGLSVANSLLWVPKIGKWDTNVFSSISVSTLTYFVALALLLLLISSISVIVMKYNPKGYVLSFPLVFALSFIAILIANQSYVNYLGLEYVLWALLLGLFINNVIGLPEVFKSSIKTELFIKTGLVLLGAEILFNTLLSAGAFGLFEITVGLFTVWYFCYYLAIKLGLSKSFACVMASATSICGVSAAIATGGAVKGDPKEVSYTI